MVRAAATGAVNFSQADPRDKWWWRRLGWILDEINADGIRKILEVRHSHWITIFSNPGLEEEGFDKAQENARKTLHQLTLATFPWLKDVIGEEPEQVVDDAVSWFRSEYGHPGEPRYEAMISTIKELFARKESDA